ncbi:MULTISPECIES: LCP family protein [Kitasatospora]|uniref:Transcriptional regulator n=1 Tax=Kitasatospora cystarginea TaxID=58350 RepID=A0ABN3E6N7_9ACTN
MSGQRAGASGHDAEWWRDGGAQGGSRLGTDAPRGVPGPRRGAGAADAPRLGGRAAARRGNGGGDDGDGGGRGGRGAGRGGGPRGKQKRSKKKIVAWVAASSLVLLVAGAGALYLKLNGNLSTFGQDGVSKDRPEAGAADANGNRPVNVLLIGSDSRGGSNKDLGGGGDAGARSDTTILLHIYADHKHAVGISFPRDALVTRPACKLPNGKWTKEENNVMFNSAFAVGDTDKGNPACTQNTVEKLTNLRVDHTMVVDFEGFAAMTSAIGGVTVCLPNAIYEGDLDPNLGHKGKQIFAKGEQTVEGQQALDYVRLRHGVGDGSDIGRMKRQQAFLSALIKDVKGKGMSPTNLLPLADAATKSLTVDEGLGTADKLLSFALSLKAIDLHDIKFITAPWKYEGARVALVHPDAEELFAALKADRTLDGQDASGGASASPSADASTAPASDGGQSTAAPASVDGAGIRVGIYNGTTTSGLANAAETRLKDAKFTVTTKTNAATRDHATTSVQYGPGDKAKAQTVASVFPGATLEPVSRAGINVVLGKDFAAAGGSGAGGASSGSSAAPGPLPTSVSNGARSADDDPCSNVSYG